MSVSRNVLVFVCTVGLLAAACSSNETAQDSRSAASAPSAFTSEDPVQAEAIMKIVDDYMVEAHLKSVIVRVTADGKEIVTAARGESMTGVPATTAMHFRNGAVAISYVSTLLLILADERKLSLDDKLSKYLAAIPNADRVNLRQLAQMTSGYHDFVLGNTKFAEIAYADPYKAWTTQEQLALAIDDPLWFEPGTNWAYAHTNYVLLGLALEKVTGKSLADALQEKVLGPLDLKNTEPNLTPYIPEPVLHSFTSERREFFELAPEVPFYEESTYWNPSWTLSHGAIQTSDIYDLERSAVAIGSGELLSGESYRAMTTTDLRGRTTAVPGCVNCRALDDFQTYGLGLWLTGDWSYQNPLFYGSAAVNAYLPSKKIAIAVAVTYQPQAFSASGGYSNGGDALFRKIGAYLAPGDAPPVKKDVPSQGGS
ncbi:serine hydrolase domain-containing protein [Nocardia fluminea]|uniref:CubicO group peptidase (Beta-lactamase class C family) n=1 Tax=Nocardia fluminea TaxID=134984 RepID=A0A2N3VJW2_9NOCA|nr:serine hydrolase domain-containing protein [Nocardia fluminea]PKV81909.1 CubicO group peptidase (beta-lactamase class C family) [Nocardia fluminea]